MASAHVLRAHNFGRKFSLYVDAAEVAIGRELCHEGNGFPVPVANTSKKLEPSYRRYATSEKEDLEVLHCLDKLAVYVDNGKKCVYTVVTVYCNCWIL